MRFDILTLFPEFFSNILGNSITGNAVKKGILEYNYINIRDFADDKHNRVDDYPFGGGMGMLLRPQPVFNAYNYAVRNCLKKPYTIYMSPRGKVFNQQIACELAKEEHIIIICGHYEGIDQRVIDELCDCELSIGDFVITGGEIAALAVCDAVSRIVPGVLSDKESYENESHYNGLLEFSQYTRPRVFNGVKVPDVLLSGNKSEIDKWKYSNSVEITKINRYDMYEKCLGKSQKIYDFPKSSVSVLLLGNSTEINFIKSELLMQLKKQNVSVKNLSINTCPEKFNNTVIIVCGENDFDFNYIDPDVPVLVLGLRERDTISLKDGCLNFNNFTGKIDLCTTLQMGEKIRKFCTTLDMIEKIRTGEFLKEILPIRLIKPIPYDAFENNASKFNDYNIDDLYLFDCKNLEINSCYTLITEKHAFAAEVFSVKTKNLGRKYCIAVKNFSKIFRGLSGKILGIFSDNISDIYNNAIKFKSNDE